MSTTCSKCNIAKSLDQFHKGKKVCKTCVKDQQAALKRAREEVEDTDPRVCTKCTESKQPSDFERTDTGGYRKVCRQCRKTGRSERVKEARVNHNPDAVEKPNACVKCGKGPDEVDFPWRTDNISGNWRNECNKCINAKEYYKDYRVRKIAENKEEFNAHNAKVHLEWAHKNPEKVKEQQMKTATVPDRKIKLVRTTAKQQKVPFAEEDVEKMKEKFGMPCEFCAYEPSLGEELNGLDQLVAGQGYTDANTVPCCATCNAMKCVMSVDEFLMAVREIHAHLHSNNDDALPLAGQQRRTLPPAFSGSAERREADDVDKTCRLSDEERIELWGGSCYLCGRSPAFGYDRVDAKVGYVPDNVRSCCTICNYMKKDVELQDFKMHVGFIHKHTMHWVLKDISDIPVACIGRMRNPVQATLGDGRTIIFPSVSTAELVLGTAKSVSVALSTDDNSHCAKWERVVPRVYREHRHQEGSVYVIRDMRAMKRRK